MIEQYEKSIKLLEDRLKNLNSCQSCKSDLFCRRSLILQELEDLYCILNYLKGVSPTLRLSTLGYNSERVSTDYCNSLLL